MDIPLFLDEDHLSANDLVAEFTELSLFLATLRTQGRKPKKKSTVYYAKVADGVELYKILYEDDSILDIDVRRALSAQLDGMLSWDDEKGADCSLATRAMALNWVQSGLPAACIVVKTFEVDTGDDRLAAVSGMPALRLFYSRLPELLNLKGEAYIEVCRFAFCRLLFKPGIEDEMDKFSAGLVRNRITEALAALNDHLAKLLDANTPHAEIGARFAAATGFQISPESPNTHGNAQAMRQRNVEFEGNIFVCEWHLKFEPHRDRIHIHFFDGRIGNGQQILIGIFCEHLLT